MDWGATSCHSSAKVNMTNTRSTLQHFLQLPTTFDSLGNLSLTSAARTASSCSSYPRDRAWWACRWWRTHPGSGQSSPETRDKKHWQKFKISCVRLARLRRSQVWSPRWCTACHCTHPPRYLEHIRIQRVKAQLPDSNCRPSGRSFLASEASTLKCSWEPQTRSKFDEQKCRDVLKVSFFRDMWS